MKRIFSLFLLILLAFSALLLSGCSRDAETEVDENILMLQIYYIGEPVTETDHEFKPEEFSVVALYPEGEEISTTHTVELVSLKDGAYTVNITYKGHEQIFEVPLQMAVYPSETN